MTNIGPALHIRKSKRTQIAQLFESNLGREFSSAQLHARFGSSVRTRISEINRDGSSRIMIRNSTRIGGGGEYSTYWAEMRQPSAQLNLLGER